MKKTKEIKLMIIENFIEYYTTDEEERKLMKLEAVGYVSEDHYDEIDSTLESVYHDIDSECITETDTVKMDSVRKVLSDMRANNEEMDGDEKILFPLIENLLNEDTGEISRKVMDFLDSIDEEADLNKLFYDENNIPNTVNMDTLRLVIDDLEDFENYLKA